MVWKDEKKRMYYEENKERSLAQQRVWAEKNKSKVKARKQKYYEEHKEREKERSRKWDQTNKDDPTFKRRRREACRRYYYKKRGTKSGDIQRRVYEEAALKYLKESGFKPISNISVGNVECTETGTHRYPDALMWCKGFALIVEIDENAHRGAAYECDFRRMAEICGCLSAPVWFVRYKPDAPESNLEELAEKVRSIQEQEEPEWKFLNFNVDYMFYNERDMMVARERMLAAKR